MLGFGHTDIYYSLYDSWGQSTSSHLPAIVPQSQRHPEREQSPSVSHPLALQPLTPSGSQPALRSFSLKFAFPVFLFVLRNSPMPGRRGILSLKCRLHGHPATGVSASSAIHLYPMALSPLRQSGGTPPLLAGKELGFGHLEIST